MVSPQVIRGYSFVFATLEYTYFLIGGIIHVNNQLYALFDLFFFHFCTCVEQPSAHHQENQLYQHIIWYMSLCVSDCLVCQSGGTGILDSHLHRYIPDDVLIQLILLIMSTGLFETCTEVK